MNSREEQIKFEGIINEFFETEASYNKAILNICQAVRANIGSLLPEDQLKLDKIISAYEKLQNPILNTQLKSFDERFKELQAVFGSDDGIKKIYPLQDAILMQSHFMNFMDQMAIFNAKWLDALKADLRKTGMGTIVESYIIPAAQRCPKFEMLFREILKKDKDPESPMHKFAENALNRIVSFMIDTNKELKSDKQPNQELCILITSIMKALVSIKDPKDKSLIIEALNKMKDVDPVCKEGEELEKLTEISMKIAGLNSKDKKNIDEVIIKSGFCPGDTSAKKKKNFKLVDKEIKKDAKLEAKRLATIEERDAPNKKVEKYKQTKEVQKSSSSIESSKKDDKGKQKNVDKEEGNKFKPF